MDFGTCSTKKEIHAYLKEQFEFPDYYGENLDALYDCLTDLAEDIEIHFEERKGDTFREADPEEERHRGAEGAKRREESEESKRREEFKEPKGEKESKEPKAPKKPKEPMDEKIQQYMKKVRQVIGDAAEENSHLYL